MRWICYALAGALLWAPASAEEHRDDDAPETGEIPRELLEIRELLAEAMEREGDDRREEALGRTVNLQFRLVPDEDSAVAISCATTRFRVQSRRSEGESSAFLGIEGELATLDDGRIGVVFDCRIEIETAGSESVEFDCHGSTVVRPGKEATLAVMGKFALKVDITESE